ncbi:hypothetical protein [Jatrophihabitans endophyticus]|uniref:hypothetical protein n=1 Tax=Jatrophihabitans endophyticus TaxID=1206085 RepID=UPI0019FA7328|nr:hypothetical protein [Jatrophihabitans endophyticus]MBE7189838.1 hypothetical protein [Jatrophihabitans endophyticus]
MRWLPIAARVFVVEAVVFFLISRAFADVTAGLIGATVLGVWMAAILVGMAAFKLRGRPDVAITNRQRSSFVVPTAAPDLHALARNVLLALPADVRLDRAGHIEARTGVAWSSWGEAVTVDLMPVDAGTAVDVQARPRMRWAIISDYRRTRGLVDHVAAGLAGPVTAAPSPDPALS